MSWLRARPAVATLAIASAVAVLVLGVVLTSGDDEVRTRTGDETSACTTGSHPTSSLSTTSIPGSSAATTPRSSPATRAPTTSPPPTAPTAPVGGPSEVLRTLPSPGRSIALTFDAGSDTGSTAEILDLLAARGMNGSFGLTGCWVDDNPSLARRIVTNGHTIINHTQDHPSFTGYSTDSAPLLAAERTAQVLEAEQGIAEVTGKNPRPWFRPPYGDYDQSVLDDVGALGYRYTVMWSIDSLGWKSLPPNQVAARVIDELRPGTIVLMHVGSQSTDIDALPAILDAVDSRGLEAVSLDGFFGART